MPAVIEIRDATQSDWPGWQRMWSAYCAYFNETVPEEDVQESWRRILDPDHSLGALVSISANHQGSLVGFAHYVLHPHTFSSRLVCYLEDLWVDANVRGEGIGRKLIETLTARGRDRGWRRIYWHTEADNTVGRVLYDRVARLTEYVRYDVSLP